MWEKRIGEFTISVTDPYPYWITVKHEFSDRAPKFEHEQLDDLIYGLTQARKHIEASRDAQRKLSSGAPAPQTETERKTNG